MMKRLCAAVRAMGASIGPASLTLQEQAFRAHQRQLMANERARRADRAVPHPEIEHE